jgi:hypothetical protein
VYLSKEIKSTSIVNKKSKPINVFRFEIYWNFDNNTHTHTERERKKERREQQRQRQRQRVGTAIVTALSVSFHVVFTVKWKNDSSKLHTKLYQTRLALVSPRER